MTDRDALTLTPDVLEAVVKHCVADAPNEACGFIVADKGSPVGTGQVRMANVDLDPVRGYRMDDPDVISAYSEFDSAGLEPVAVYHSHTFSAPIMSERDLERAHDTSLAYLIVSVDGPPRARAYRVRRPFVGVAEHREVHIVVTGQDDVAVMMPEGPWALTPGNQVTITYSRPRVTATTTVTARVASVGAGAVALEPFAPGQRNVPPSLPLDRIRQVEVLQESPEATELRRTLRTHARHVVAALGSGDVGPLPTLTRALAEAFPTAFRVLIREEA